MEKIAVLVMIMLFVLGGLVYFSNQITGDVIKEEHDEVIIPVKVHRVVEEYGAYTSSRNEENVILLLEEANRIWKQGGVYFQIEGYVETNFSFEAIPNAINGKHEELSGVENYDEKKINLFLVQSLNGINGLALRKANSAMVSDFTSVNDYRTTAHEFGHLLGLGHVDSEDRLMARGRNGELLSSEEILIVREEAKELF
jgi:hypothetical protein